MFLKKLKAFLSQNSFLTTTTEYSFKCFNMQHPHTLFKLKHFVFILKYSFKNDSYNKETSITAYLAFYVYFSWWALFTKAMPTNFRICHDFNCNINERETPKNCLTNHKGSISHHITPLVINSLGGRHTNTHTHIYSHHRQKLFQETSHTLVFGQHATGLKTLKLSLLCS